MRLKLRILALIVTGLMASSSYAQNDHDRIVSIGISPISAIFGTADVTAQIKLLNFMSLTVPVHGGYNWVKSSIIGAISKAGGLDISGKDI